MGEIEAAATILHYMGEVPGWIALTIKKSPQVLPLLSSNILKQLLSHQEKVNDKILPSINNSDGYGYGASRGTIEAWNNIKEGLDYLCERWSHAQQELKYPTNKFSNYKVGEIVNELAAALDCEYQHIRALEDRIEPTTAQRRHLILIQFWPYLYSRSPESRAYNALLALYQYAKERGWTSDEGFGKVLGDGREKDPADLEPMYSEYFTVEKGVYAAKVTSTRIPHH